jgi:DNA topoisomerase-1
VERFKKISEFIPEKFWHVLALLRRPSEDSDFRVVYVGENPKNKKPFRFVSLEEAENLKRAVEGMRFWLFSASEREERKMAPPPFTTSSLLSEASRRLGFPSRKTMKVAQNLFEGGFITYHRTDSVSLSKEAIGMARGFLKERFEHLLPPRPNVFRTRVANAQEAHEAIRPTKLKIDGALSSDEKKLLELITSRLLASQCAPAVFQVKEFVFLCRDRTSKERFFRLSVKKLLKEGFMEIWKEHTGAQDEPMEDVRWSDIPQPLVDAKEGDEFITDSIQVKEDETKPPAHFTEATLIKEMEKVGIGRPSTYAQTIHTLLSRNYITKDKGKLIPTDDGIFIDEVIGECFPSVQDVHLTSYMEDELDRISTGERDWRAFLRNFLKWFEPQLEGFRGKANEYKQKLESLEVQHTEKSGQHIEKGGRKLGQAKTCPKCNSPLVIRKNSRTGRKFLGCLSFPKCRYTQSI